MTRRRKLIFIGAGSVGTVLILCLVAELRRGALMASPEKYLTETRAAELSAFARRLLENSSCSHLTVVSHRIPWSRRRIQADSALNEQEIALIIKMLRRHRLQFLRMDKEHGSVEYAGYVVSIRRWLCYTWVADDGALPPERLCATVREVRDNWYFGVY